MQRTEENCANCGCPLEFYSDSRESTVDDEPVTWFDDEPYCGIGCAYESPRMHRKYAEYRESPGPSIGGAYGKTRVTFRTAAGEEMVVHPQTFKSFAKRALGIVKGPIELETTTSDGWS